MKKKKVIVLEPNKRDALAVKYGASQSAVYNALAYRSMSEKSERIRQDALQNFGGMLISKVVFI